MAKLPAILPPAAKVRVEVPLKAMVLEVDVVVESVPIVSEKPPELSVPPPNTTLELSAITLFAPKANVPAFTVVLPV